MLAAWAFSFPSHTSYHHAITEMRLIWHKATTTTARAVPGAVVESVEQGFRMWEIVIVTQGQVKPMTYKNVYLVTFLASCSVLLG